MRSAELWVPSHRQSEGLFIPPFSDILNIVWKIWREKNWEHSGQEGPPPGVPPPPDYLPEMADELIVKNTVKALSPRIVAAHGPTGTGKSTVFPLAIAHWADQTEGLKPGLTLCAQPRRILAQQLCERVRLNRKMH